jgi:enoyl-CoA hydratase/carnithine racemase
MLAKTGLEVLYVGCLLSNVLYHHFVIFYELERRESANILRLAGDETNRLTRARVKALTEKVLELSQEILPKPLVITGNQHFFSAGADLNEIAELTGPASYDFASMGQALMNAVANFPAPTYAAIWGYCMGGGLDLALACRYRFAHPHAVFGHRGAALGLITGWGGTQRLPRLVGKARALEMFVAAEKLHASRALEIRLIDAIAEDPVSESLKHRELTTKARSHEGH